MESDPVAEGLARVIDQLSQNFISKVLQSFPLDSTGNEMSEEEQEQYEMKRKLRKQERKLAKGIESIYQCFYTGDYDLHDIIFFETNDAKPLGEGKLYSHADFAIVKD